MDDTKKLIEKYKRELMELSAKQKKSPQIIGYVDGDNNFLSNLQSDIIEESAPVNSANSRSNSEVVLEGSNSANPASSRDNSEASFKESSSANPASSRDNSEASFKESSSANPASSRGNSEVIYKGSGSENSASSRDNWESVFEEPNSAEPANRCGDLENSKMSGGKNSSPDTIEDTANSRNDPDVIFERSDSPDGSITEIIDEYTPETPQNNSGKSENNPPNYTEIPSTREVHENITENSKPRNNVIERNVSGITDNSASTPRADVADAIRTTEAQAERLNDQPVSGTDPDEQLTGRSFEGAEPLPDVDISMEQGSRAEPIDYPEQNFSNFEEFERVNTGRGSLMFRVYTGREAVVIEGAECVITKKIGNETRTLAELVTDKSGQTPVQQLPAPPKELSQHPENTIQPFALYDAEVTKPGFVRVVLKDVPVFDGVQSVQRVFMIVE